MYCLGCALFINKLLEVPMVRPLSRKYLSAQFNEQMKRLAERQAPNFIDQLLRSQRAMVLEKAVSLILKKDETAFLPVIPFTFRSFHDQMPMIEIGGKCGQTDTCQDGCIWVNTPYMHRRPWYIFHVRLGEPLAGKSINEYKQELKHTGRRPLYPEEVIAVCLHRQPRNVSLFCDVPHSNSWSQSHLLTGPIKSRELLVYGAEAGPTMYGIAGDLHSPRDQLRIPSCLI